MGLYEQLARNFPEEQTVFGVCLLVPPQAFKPEWESQLKAEGIKVFQNSYNGRVFFFLKKADINSPEPILERSSNQPQPVQAEAKEVELKPFEWTKENLELVRRLRLQGLSFRAIERKLRELGFKIHHVTIAKKLKALKEASKPTSVPKTSNCISGNDSLFREYLDGANVLFERNLKKACAVLLKEAAKILENA